MFSAGHTRVCAFVIIEIYDSNGLQMALVAGYFTYPIRNDHVMFIVPAERKSVDKEDRGLIFKILSYLTDVSNF